MMTIHIAQLQDDSLYWSAAIRYFTSYILSEIGTMDIAQLQDDTVYTGAPLLVKITFLHTVRNSDSGHSTVTR